MQENRFSERIRCATPAILVCDDIIYIDCVIRNLSCTGLAIDVTGNKLHMNQLAKIIVGKPGSGNQVVVMARVKHFADCLTGLSLEPETGSKPLSVQMIQRLANQAPIFLP